MDRTINGLFEVALEYMNRKGETIILCPCKKCKNIVLIDPSTGRVTMHLLKYDFMPGYTRWTSDGEEEKDVKVEGKVHDDELEGGVKNVAEHENHLNVQKERNGKELSKEDLDDYDQSGIYQEEDGIIRKERCKKRRRSTADAETSIESPRRNKRKASVESLRTNKRKIYVQSPRTQTRETEK